MMTCSYCHTKASKLPVCKHCQTDHYCNSKCQKGAWPLHKANCKKRDEQGRMLALLPQELIFELFQRVGVKSIVFFSVCKRFNTLRESVLTMHYLSMKHSARFVAYVLRDKSARMDIRALLHLYRWPKLESGGRYGKFKQIVLKFIAQKNRREIFYTCRNSYHRRLVHLFCEAQDLEHKTIDTGRKRTCRNDCRHSCLQNCDQGRNGEYCFCGRARQTEKGIMITKKNAHLLTFSPIRTESL